MKLGPLEIRWRKGRVLVPMEVFEQRDLSGVFAVPIDEPWWLAVHAIIDAAEQECVDGARKRIQSTNACISAVGAGEGCDLVRQKLVDARDIALEKGGIYATQKR